MGSVAFVVDTLSYAPGRRTVGTSTYPAVAAPQLAAISPGSAPPPPAAWTGSAADTATATSEELTQQRHQLHAAHTSAGTAITEAAQISRDAHTQLRHPARPCHDD